MNLGFWLGSPHEPGPVLTPPQALFWLAETEDKMGGRYSRAGWRIRVESS